MLLEHRGQKQLYLDIYIYIKNYLRKIKNKITLDYKDKITYLNLKLQNKIDPNEFGSKRDIGCKESDSESPYRV